MSHARAAAAVLLAIIVATLAPAAAAALTPAGAQPIGEQQERPPTGDLKIYVPIEAPVLEAAPVADGAGDGSGRGVVNGSGSSAGGGRSTTERAAQALATSFDTAATVPLVKVPGTAIPLWWLLLVLLAVPLARLWRSWTARMFV